MNKHEAIASSQVHFGSCRSQKQSQEQEPIIQCYYTIIPTIVIPNVIPSMNFFQIKLTLAYKLTLVQSNEFNQKLSN